MPAAEVERCLVLAVVLWAAAFTHAADWSEAELSLLRQHWIGSLQELPPDPGNRVSNHPGAAELGERLFFDERLSGNGRVSCATCHVPEKAFTDGRPQARGLGLTARSSPTLIGAGYAPWHMWDGRSDSLWSQALGPLESEAEHGADRSMLASVISEDPIYRGLYEPLFGPLPDLSDGARFPRGASPKGDAAALAKWQGMAEKDRAAVTWVFVNIGKAIAAYVRTLVPGPSRFDQYAERVLNGDPAGGGALTDEEVLGLKLFLGKAMCTTCHMGPLFTNHGFHNVGAPNPSLEKPKYRLPILHLFAEKPVVDAGRYEGIRLAMAGEFNCLSEYSDAARADCAELIFANKKHRETLGAFKVPTLRNVARTGPYMHKGQFEGLADVLRHYNEPPKSPSGHSELLPLGLTESEMGQLEAFLRSLNSPLSMKQERATAGLH